MKLIEKLRAAVDWIVANPKRLFGVYFLYPALLAILVQFVILPYLFPQFHAGHGLLKGGDWPGFHADAAEMAARIDREGWGAWELWPEGEAQVGIAAAVYAITVPEPWTLIPINAGMHALAALTLFYIFLYFTDRKDHAFYATLPLWLFPSAMTWYAQNHKDGYYIAGFMLLLHGFLRLLKVDNKAGLRSALWTLGELVLGLGLIWLVRKQTTDVVFLLGGVAGLVVIGTLLWRSLCARSLSVTGLLLPIGAVVALVLAANWIVRDGNNNPFDNGPSASTQTEAAGQAPAPTEANPPAAEQTANQTPSLQDDPRWDYTGWPDFIEYQAFKLARTRLGFIRAQDDGAASSIDIDIDFRSVGDVIRYIPRAIEISFLAPFPADWFGSGSLEQNTLMRRASAAEMLVVYLSLLGIPLGFTLWWRKPEFWVAGILALGFMVVQAETVTNVGTLYRLRYGFLMTLVGLAFLAIFTYWGRAKRKH